MYFIKRRRIITTQLRENSCSTELRDHQVAKRTKPTRAATDKRKGKEAIQQPNKPNTRWRPKASNPAKEDVVAIVVEKNSNGGKSSTKDSGICR